MAHDYLNDAGIESFIFDAGSSRLLSTTAAVPTRLMVHRNASRDARARLKELGFDSASKGDSPICLQELSSC